MDTVLCILTGSIEFFDLSNLTELVIGILGFIIFVLFGIFVDENRLVFCKDEPLVFTLFLCFYFDKKVYLF